MLCILTFLELEVMVIVQLGVIVNVDCGLSIGIQIKSSILPNARPNAAVFGCFCLNCKLELLSHHQLSFRFPEGIESGAVLQNFYI